MSAVKEVWKAVDGYEGLYEVSDHGRVKSFHFNKNGKIRMLNNKKGDYFRLPLTDARGINRTFLVHRLVARTFIGDIPLGYEVHHIDGNKQNNVLSNLQIISSKDHKFETIASNPQSIAGMVRYNTENMSKPIDQYSLSGQFIQRYKNAREASEITGVTRRNISQVAAGTPFNNNGNKRKQAGGYIWRYAEEREVMMCED